MSSGRPPPSGPPAPPGFPGSAGRTNVTSQHFGLPRTRPDSNGSRAFDQFTPNANSSGQFARADSQGNVNTASINRSGFGVPTVLGSNPTTPKNPPSFDDSSPSDQASPGEISPFSLRPALIPSSVLNQPGRHSSFAGIQSAPLEDPFVTSPEENRRVLSVQQPMHKGASAYRSSWNPESSDNQSEQGGVRLNNIVPRQTSMPSMPSVSLGEKTSNSQAHRDYTHFQTPHLPGATPSSVHSLPSARVSQFKFPSPAFQQQATPRARIQSTSNDRTPSAQGSRANSAQSAPQTQATPRSFAEFDPSYNTPSARSSQSNFTNPVYQHQATPRPRAVSHAVHGMQSAPDSQGNNARPPIEQQMTPRASASRLRPQTEQHKAKAVYCAELIKSGRYVEPHDQAQNSMVARAGSTMNPAAQPWPHAVPAYALDHEYVNSINQDDRRKMIIPSGTTNGMPYQPHVVPAHPPFNMPGQSDPIAHRFKIEDTPALQTVLNWSPFANLPGRESASKAGVVKITEIPYSATRSQILLLFAGSRIKAMPLKTPFYAIHITMERSTAKSLDAYVEFETPRDAALAISRYAKPPYPPIGSVWANGSALKRPRVGNRDVFLFLSSQGELMANLFPRAKCVTWEGQEPKIRSAPTDWESDFKEFITGEELTMILKHATNPKRSHFAVEHPQRTYESMISIINKFPWWRTDLYTVQERNNIYDSAVNMIETLANLIHAHKVTKPALLSLELLEELLTVALCCPGFSENQRNAIQVASREMVGQPRWVSDLASHWPFETLRRLDNRSEELLKWYAAKLKWYTMKILGDDAMSASATPEEAEKAREIMISSESNHFGGMHEFRSTLPSETTFQQAFQHENSILTHLLTKICEDAFMKKQNFKDQAPKPPTLMIEPPETKSPEVSNRSEVGSAGVAGQGSSFLKVPSEAAGAVRRNSSRSASPLPVQAVRGHPYRETDSPPLHSLLTYNYQEQPQAIPPHLAGQIGGGYTIVPSPVASPVPMAMATMQPYEYQRMQNILTHPLLNWGPVMGSPAANAFTPAPITQSDHQAHGQVAMSHTPNQPSITGRFVQQDQRQVVKSQSQAQVDTSQNQTELSNTQPSHGTRAGQQAQADSSTEQAGTQRTNARHHRHNAIDLGHTQPPAPQVQATTRPIVRQPMSAVNQARFPLGRPQSVMTQSRYQSQSQGVTAGNNAGFGGLGQGLANAAQTTNTWNPRQSNPQPMGGRGSNFAARGRYSSVGGRGAGSGGRSTPGPQ
ncbi:MAG: hypothetical protein Q9162_001249 [Coniocarpon cinnabarinum]